MMENTKPIQKLGQGFKKVAGALISVGAPVLANATLGPAGVQIVSQIVQNLGLGPEASEEEIEKAIIAADPQLLAEIKRIDLQMLEAQNAAMISKEENDTRRIESVNEVIKAEVIGNPEAGAWRPMWGRWSCVSFFLTVKLLIVAALVCILTDRLDYLSLFPMIIGALVGLYSLPASILGVASYHRGIEKRVLAGEIRPKLPQAIPIES